MDQEALPNVSEINEEGAEQQRRTAGNDGFLQDWEKKKTFLNNRVKVKVYGKKIPSRLPTRQNVYHYGKSYGRVKMEAKRPTILFADVNFSVVDLINVVDTYDRPGRASAQGIYAKSGTYATALNNKPMERIPKAGAYAEAGVGRAKAEYSIFEAEARGPNAAASADASLARVGAMAMARAEIGSVSVSAGPVTVRLGLGVNTGVSVGVDGLQVQVLGTGFRVGPKPKVTFLGSEVKCVIQ